MSRKLSAAQHARLDRIADEEEGTIVVGWHPAGGPILKRQRNGESRNDRGAFRWINGWGHIKPLMTDVLRGEGLLS